MEKFYLYHDKNLSRSEIEKLNNAKLVAAKTEHPSFSKVVKMLEGKNFLDLGCAYGELSRVLAEKGFIVHGIDRVESFITIAKEFNSTPNTYYEKRDFLEEPFPDETFDGIIFLETIEHVENPTQYLKEFHRILKPEGYFIVSTPNATSLKNMFYALSYRSKNKRNKIIKEIASEPRQTGNQLEHIYNWDFPTLVRLFDRCGFNVVDHAYTGTSIKIPFFGKKYKFRREPKIFNKIEPLKKTQILKCKKKSNETRNKKTTY